MARLDDFTAELNSVTDSLELTTHSGTLSITSSSPITGTYSFLTNPSASTGFFRHQVYTSNQNKGAYLKGDLNIATLPGTTIQILRFSDTSNAHLSSLRLHSDGTLTLHDASNAQVGSASAALSTNTKYTIEIKNDSTNATGTLDCRLNGTSFASGNNSSRGSWARILWGAITPNSTCSIKWDNIIINDDQGASENSWAGFQQTITLFPNAQGEANQWLKTAGGAGDSSNYQLVDDVPPNDATDYVKSKTLNDTDWYDMTNSGLGAADEIKAITYHIRLANDVADATTAVKLQVEKAVSGTVSQGTAIIPNSTTFQTDDNPATFKPTLVLYNDPDGNPWTQSTIDSMRVGQKITAGGTNYILVSSIFANVSYLPATLQTITGKARITATTDQTNTGKSRITKTNDVTQTGKARIVAESSLRTNLVPNPSFEYDAAGSTQVPTGWTDYGATGLTYKGVSTNFSHGRSKSYEITNGSATDAGIKLQIPCGKYDTVTLSAWVKTNAGVTNANMTLTTDVTGAGSLAVQNIGANQNARFSISASGPWTNGYAEVFIGLGSFGSTSSGTVYFDEVMVEISPYGDPTLYFDGSTSGAVGWTGTTDNSTSTFPKNYIQGKARISQNTDQTITGKSRISQLVDKTQTAVSRITAETLQTNTGKARVTQTVDRTQTGVANIVSGNTETFRDQTGLARITKTVDRTQTAVSRITATVDSTQTGKSRISINTDSTQTGVSRITVTTDQTNTGKSRIAQLVDQTQTAVSRITKTTDQATTGKARIIATTDQTNTGKARVTATTDRTNTGLSRITATTDRTQTAVARITQQVLQTIAGVSRIRQTVDQDIAGKSRISQLADQIISGISRINASTNQNITGLARITAETLRTQTGKANMVAQTLQTQTGKANLLREVLQTQTGKARILHVTIVNLEDLVLDGGSTDVIIPGDLKDTLQIRENNDPTIVGIDGSGEIILSPTGTETTVLL